MRNPNSPSGTNCPKDKLKNQLNENPKLVALSEDLLDDVVEIEKECFGHESRADFLNCITRTEVYSYFVLMESSGEVVGYYGIMNISGDGELLTIAVKKSHRGKGYGELMARSAMLMSSLKGSTCLFLEVNENNTAAKALYHKIGFQEISRREKYYGEDDAIIMKLELQKSAKDGD